MDTNEEYIDIMQRWKIDKKLYKLNNSKVIDCKISEWRDCIGFEDIFCDENIIRMNYIGLYFENDEYIEFTYNAGSVEMAWMQFEEINDSNDIYRMFVGKRVDFIKIYDSYYDITNEIDDIYLPCNGYVNDSLRKFQILFKFNNDEEQELDLYDSPCGFYYGVLRIDHNLQDLNVLLNDKLKVKIIIGAPGSGKTYHINSIKNTNNIKIDDYLNTPNNMFELVNGLYNEKNIIITDHRFVIIDNIMNLLNTLHNLNIKNNQIYFIIYENNMNKCINNVKKRNDDINKFIENIKLYSNNYINFVNYIEENFINIIHKKIFSE